LLGRGGQRAALRARLGEWERLIEARQEGKGASRMAFEEHAALKAKNRGRLSPYRAGHWGAFSN
jgi:hypothetical protein